MSGITLQKENFAKSTLDGGILIGAGSIDIQAGDEALFPASGPFRAVIWGAAYTTPQDDANREIVEAEVSSSAVSFDITRAQEGTVAKAWDDGDHFALVFTKETIEEIEDAIELEHNASGSHKRFPVRAKFGWSDADTITLETATYEHNGTTQQTVYWNSQIVFNAGDNSADSNPDSSALGNNEKHYIYIDDSAVVASGSPILTDSELLNSTTAPTWNDAKQGRYNGNDKCIGAFVTDGSGNILEFHHDGGRFIQWDAHIEDVPPEAIASASWETKTLTAPFEKIMCIIRSGYGGTGAANLFYRITGSSGTGILLCACSVNTSGDYTRSELYTNSSGQIDLKYSAEVDNTALVYTAGFYLPVGM